MGMTWRLPDDISAARRAALEVAGQALADEAAARAPRLTGELAESRYADVADEDTVRVGFRAPYARKQHERTDFEHSNGGAKFLYDAAGDFGPEFERIAAGELARRLGG